MAKQGFISWSGDGSRQIAEHLKKFFNHTLAAPTMFVASKDLKAGEVWFTEIAQRLDACDVGVIVVTPQNVQRPWLHFEAGAIAKRVGRSAAIPLLCGVSTGDLSGTPLAQLQAITTAEKDIRDLCSRLNELLELGLPEDHINESFPVWWEKLHSGIDDPSLWKATKTQSTAITLADLSVQLSQMSASIADLSDKVDRTQPGSLHKGLMPDPTRLAEALKALNRNEIGNIYYPTGSIAADTFANDSTRWRLGNPVTVTPLRPNSPTPPKSISTAPSAPPPAKAEAKPRPKSKPVQED